MGIQPRRGGFVMFLGILGGVLCGEGVFAGMIGVTLLILAPPMLLSRPPDPTTILGHMATCPNCLDLEANPVRCGKAMEVVQRNYAKWEADRRNHR